jgi:hypothetical protein
MASIALMSEDQGVANGASYTGATWSDDPCPDGTNSDSDGGTCINNLG